MLDAIEAAAYKMFKEDWIYFDDGKVYYN
jgi:hypothetical protein